MRVDLPLSEFGARLQRVRDERGISLRDVANATKISLPALEAIERNDLKRLPGGIFVRAFVRAYARELGLDPEATLRDFLAQCPEAPGEETPERHERLPVTPWQPDHDRRGLRLLVRLTVVSLPLVAVIAYYSLVPLVWTRSSGAPPAARPLATEAAVSTAVPAVDVRQPSTAAVPEPPPAASAPTAALVLALKPTAECWMWAQADGTTVLSRLVPAGEEVRVEASRELLLKVGDAAAVAFTLNGVPGRPLGRPGQVVTARIDAENFRSFLAAP